MCYRTGSEAVWIEPEGKLTGTVPHAAIRKRVGKEILTPFSPFSGSCQVPPIGQARKGKPEFKGPQGSM